MRHTMIEHEDFSDEKEPTFDEYTITKGVKTNEEGIKKDRNRD